MITGLFIYSFYRVSNDDDDDYGYFTLTFNIEFPHDNDTVYFAHSYPYTYSDLQVSSIRKHLIKGPYRHFIKFIGLFNGNSTASS